MSSTAASRSDQPFERLLTDLAAGLESGGVAHAFLRGVARFPHVDEGCDVDLLVPARQLESAADEVARAAERNGVDVQGRRRAGARVHLHLAVLAANGRPSFLAIALHGGLTCGGVPVLEADELLAHVLSGSPRRLAPELAALVSVLAIHLDRQRVPDRDVERLKEAFVERGWELEPLLERVLGPRDARELTRWVLASDASWCLRLAARHRRRALRRAFARRPLHVLLHCVAVAWARSVRARRRPEGRYVAVIGAEGSGAGELLDAIAPVLEPACRRGAGTWIVRAGPSPRLAALDRERGSRADGARQDPARRKPPSGRIFSNVRVAWHALATVVFHALRVRPLRRRRALILADGTFDDLVIDPLRFRVQPRTRLVGLLAPFVPRPDRVLVVSAPPQVLCARRRELRPEECSRQVDDYEALAVPGGRFHIVPNDGLQGVSEAVALRALFPLHGAGRSRRASSSATAGATADAAGAPVPLGVDRWYPALVAGASAFHTVAGAPRLSWDEIAGAWERVGLGEALVAIDRPARRLARLTRLGRRSWPARFARSFPGAARRDRWLIVRGSAGDRVLLHPDRAAFVAGLALLPAVRLRERVARRTLEILARLRLTDRLGLGEIAVLVNGPSASPAVPWIGAELVRPALDVAVGAEGRQRRATVVAFDETVGKAQGVLELSLGEAAPAAVRREVAALERLAEIAPEGSLSPVLLAHGDAAGGAAWLVQEVLPGEASSQEMTQAHASFLAALHWRTATMVPFEELETFAEACARIEAVREAVDERWWTAMTGLRDALRKCFEGRAVPCAMAHGDFTPWNLLSDGGHLRAIGWDKAIDRAPALFDLAHFHVQTGVRLRRDRPSRVLASFHDLLMRSIGAGLLRQFKIEMDEVSGLLGLYVLYVASVDEEGQMGEALASRRGATLRRARIALALALRTRVGG